MTQKAFAQVISLIEANSIIINKTWSFYIGNYKLEFHHISNVGLNKTRTKQN